MRGYCRQQLVTPQNTVARLPTCITSKTVLESGKVWFTRTLVAWVTALARPDVLAMNLGDLIAQESGLDVERVNNGHYLFAGSYGRERRWSSRARLICNSLVHGNDGGDQSMELSDGFLIGQFSILEVAGLEVDRSRYHVGAEPSKHRPQLAIDGQIMVIGSSHCNQAAHLSHQSFNGYQVQKVLQRRGERRPEDRGRDQKHIGIDHLLYYHLGIVFEGGQGPAVSERDPMVTQV